MIKHDCTGSLDGRFPPQVYYFADPGEPAMDIEGATTYYRKSTDVGMNCPACGAPVPYKIIPISNPVATGEPKFEVI